MKLSQKRSRHAILSGLAASVLLLATASQAQETKVEPITGVVAPAGLVGVDAAKLQQHLTDGDVTSVELVEAYLKRIAAFDQPYDGQLGLTGMTRVIGDEAMERAKALDAERAEGKVRGPLHGIPMLLKEVFDFEGYATTDRKPIYGEAMEGILAPDNAHIVSKLLDAGVIVLGMTASGSTYAGNPYNQTLHPGGSSSGNAAGIAAGFAPIGLGSDTGGSLRIPPAFTATIGFRPTTGLVSGDGVAPFTGWADTAGPQALTIRDIAVMMDVIAGYDETYGLSVKMDMPETYTEHLSEDYLSGKTVGIWTPAMTESTDDVRNAIYSTVDILEQLGATVVEISPSFRSGPDMIPGTELLLSFPGAENFAGSGSDKVAAQNVWLAGLQADDSELAKKAEPFDKLTQDDREVALELKHAVDSPPEQLAQAAEARANFKTWFEGLTQESNIDFVIYPSVRHQPTLRDTRIRVHNSWLATLLAYPALSMPAGYVNDLPVNIEFMGTASGTDAEVLGAAYAFEQASHFRQAPASTPALEGEEALFD